MTAIDPARRPWDPVVRLTHWTVVGAVLLNALVLEKGEGPHIWVGYGLTAVLALRMIWGVIGPPEARFSAFPPSPARALSHIRDIRAGRSAPHASHNPLGALMVYAIWATLAVIAVTGILMANGPGRDREAAGAPMMSPSAAYAPVEAGARGSDEEDEEEGEREGEEEGPLGELHEAAATVLYGLILLHLAGVVFETRRTGRPIVRRMLSGRPLDQP